jgi:nucleotide-binding universal stress UspA family protein
MEAIMPEDPSPIVVGVDGSPPAEHALRWAAGDAVRHGRPLRIVHAAEPWKWDVPFYPAPMMAESIDEVAEKILHEAAGQVAQWHADLPVTTALVHDVPTVALREQARGAYEVVVGHRGLGGFSSLLLGSVGLHTVGYAEGTVVVVRGGDRERGEVLAGIDLSDHSAAALEYAFEAAAARTARLKVVHAWSPPEGPYAVLEVTDLEEAAVQTLHEVLQPWKDRYPAVTVTAEAVRGHPVGTLVHASGEADLVVVAARGHSGLRLGSVSHGLIHHAACPVAVAGGPG